ncbi:MAG: hypothetical protein SFU56_06055 [Capsulimonadales bacterium]|nr:hypothetical protein [Capsulimonadales bacterium]
MRISNEPEALTAGLTVEEQRRLADEVMRKQVALSIRVAVVFLILLLGLPLFNFLLPDLAGTILSGFTLTWLLLGILFYPLTWFLSGYFIRESDRIESELVSEHREG